MFTYKFIVRADKGNSLRLRLTNNRKMTEVSLGLQMTQETLDDALSSKPRPENLKWRSVLSMYQTKLDDIKCDMLKNGGGNEDVKAIKELVLSEVLNRGETINGTETKEADEAKGNFLPHFRKFADAHQNKRTRSIYHTTASRMHAFAPNLSELNFEDITVEWLTEFDSFLSENAPKKNSRNIHFRNIRAVMKDAFAADLTIAHPFDRFKHAPEKTRKRSLSLATLRKVFNAEVKPWQQKYLDFFKLSFMLIGINVADLCGATELYNDRLEYNRAKTGKLYSIKVEPEALEIINKYRGEKKLLGFVEGYSDYRYFYNNLCIGLAAIREQLGLKELTTYWARHTWSTIAFNECGVSKDVIAKALGHSDGHDITNIYIDENSKLVDDANRRVLDWVLYGKGQL